MLAPTILVPTMYGRSPLPAERTLGCDPRDDVGIVPYDGDVVRTLRFCRDVVQAGGHRDPPLRDRETLL